jgi:DNA repair protein RadC
MKIKNAKDVYYYFKDKIGLNNKEQFYVLFLDFKNDILSEELISIGPLNSNLIYPIDIFKPAIELNANYIILVHNHPSGSPFPCNEDLVITEMLRRIGDITRIPVLDHIIIGKECFASI